MFKLKKFKESEKWKTLNSSFVPESDSDSQNWSPFDLAEDELIDLAHRDMVQRKQEVNPVCRDMTFETSPWDRMLFEKSQKLVPEFKEAIGVGAEKVQTWPGFTREVFSRLLNRRDAETFDDIHEGDKWASDLHQTMSGLPELASLKERTVSDTFWSGVASSIISEKLRENYLDKAIDGHIQDQKKLEAKKEALEEMLLSADGDAEKKLIEELVQKTVSEIEDSKQNNPKNIDSVSVRASLRDALQSSIDEISDASEMMGSIGVGDNEGIPGKTDPEIKAEIAKRLKNSRKLQEVSKIAGRMKSFAKQKKKTKTESNSSEIHSIERGNDVTRVLPSEFALLKNDATSNLFYQRYSESSLQQFKLEGKEKEGQGPIVLCVDNSGSMSGKREFWSKGLALALMNKCKEEKRDFILLHFDTKIQFRLEYSPSQDLPDGKILDAIEFFSSGGTDFEDVIQEASNIIERSENQNMKKADIVIVTDGAVNVRNQTRRRFKRCSERTGACLIGVVLAGSSKAIKDLGGEAFELTNLKDDEGVLDFVLVD